MKPDGTPTVDEIMAQVETLQSWEKAELVQRIEKSDTDAIERYVKGLTARQLRELTDCRVYDDTHDIWDDIDYRDVLDHFDLDGILERCDPYRVLNCLNDKDILAYVKNNLL